MKETWFGDPVPDLGRIPEEEWAAALLRVPPDARDRAIHHLPDWDRKNRATEIVLLELPKCNPRRIPSPVPRTADAAARRGLAEQVNMRLAPRDRARLGEAAKLVGLRPTQLARMLVTNGVRRILIDHGIDP